MHDHLTDDALRRALLRAARQDLSALPADGPPPAFSPAYQAWQAALLRDPRRAARRQVRRARPLWQRAARVAAVLLLLCALSVGAALSRTATARDGMQHWFITRHDTHNSYTYNGESGELVPQAWYPTYLPDGYKETNRLDLISAVLITFSNGDIETEITFHYSSLFRGSAFGLDNEHYTPQTVTINGISGHLLESDDYYYGSMLILFDETNRVAFLLSARLPGDTLLRIAESITLEN